MTSTNSNFKEIPFFFSPNYDTAVEPLEICCDADNPPRYEPFHYGKYVAEAFARSYGAHYQDAWLVQ